MIDEIKKTLDKRNLLTRDSAIKKFDAEFGNTRVTYADGSVKDFGCFHWLMFGEQIVKMKKVKIERRWQK